MREVNSDSSGLMGKISDSGRKENRAGGGTGGGLGRIEPSREGGKRKGKQQARNIKSGFSVESIQDF